MEIVIAGAGIAGLAAAAFLSRSGHKVAVYDQAHAPAPVGSGLIVQPTGQAVLAALGLLEPLQARAARLEQLDGRLHGGKRKVLDVRYAALSAEAYGASVHRSVLFDLLLAAARDNGAALEPGREVTSVEQSQSGASLVFADGAHSPRFDMVIDALGVRSPLIQRQSHFLKFGALWANAPFPAVHGFSTNVLAQRYRGADCSAGVMPIGAMCEGGDKLAAFFWTIRADAYQAWRDAPLDAWKEQALSLWPEIAPVLAHFTAHEQFVFAHYAHHTVRRPVEGRIVHIGDAWHAASPQLGQGANMALLDAYTLHNTLEAMPDVESALAAFVRMRLSHVRLYQTMSWLFTPFYQSNLQFLALLRDALAQPLSATAPVQKLLAGLVAGTLGAPLEKLAP